MARPNMFVPCAVALILTFAGSAIAANLHVPGDYPTIQAAVDAAIPNVDTVVVANGTYSGPGNTSVSVTKEIRIESEDLDPELCEIVGRGFLFSGDTSRGDTEVVGFTIRNGTATEGSGLYFESSATLANCVIKDCAGPPLGLGGGVYIGPASSPLIINTTIFSNSAYYGGGVYCLSNIPGGPAAELRDCAIVENLAYFSGGGIAFRQGGRISVVKTTISGNVAGNSDAPIASGGGIDGIGGALNLVNCIITESRVLGSGEVSPPRGAGMALFGGVFRIDNCLVARNDAGELLEQSGYLGGGIYTASAEGAITNCTIVDNGVTGWGGGYYEGTTTSPFPTVNIHNTIFWSGDPEEIFLASASNNVALRNCALENGLAGISGAAPAVAINVFDDEPLFVDALNDNHRLQYLSPYLNKGNAALLPSDVLDVDGDGNVVETLPLDLDGNPRQTGPASCVDIGCFENTTPSSCLGDITGGPQGVPDCVVDVDDLVQVILAWETPGGAIDFEPQPCGNGSVTVDELVDVLLNWGPCPGSGCAGDEAMPQSVDDCYDKSASLYPEGGPEFAQCFARCIEALCEADLIDCDE